MSGNIYVVDIPPVPPRTPPLLLPYHQNPRMCGNAKFEIRRCFTTSKRHAIMRRGVARIPPSLYMGRGLATGPEYVSEPPLRPHTEMIRRSLIQATAMMALS